MIVRVVASHPWHKNKNAPRMGHPEFHRTVGRQRRRATDTKLSRNYFPAELFRSLHNPRSAIPQENTAAAKQIRLPCGYCFPKLKMMLLSFTGNARYLMDRCAGFPHTACRNNADLGKEFPNNTLWRAIRELLFFRLPPCIAASLSRQLFLSAVSPVHSGVRPGMPAAIKARAFRGGCCTLFQDGSRGLQCVSFPH
jgi:hypothetical protein